ncbi:MAG: hypothetical protein NC433_15585 [Clostridiales bacterium]|nr:hypothetical protein [Clostridiales bacterium]
MVIQHNLRGLNATRNLNTTVGKKANSTEKLSSGYKVNSGADNAAAMAISENMRRRIRGMQQASFNTKDGISFAQSAEGALNEVHDLLQRANELAVKAANDTNQPEDRKAIYDEIAHLHKEINRIATSMQFNEIDMFDSSHVPSDEKNNAEQKENISDIVFLDADYMSFEMQDFSASISQAQAAGKTFTQAGLSGFANEIRNTYMPTLLGDIVSTLPQSAIPTVSGMQIGLKMYYNDDSTLAYVSSNGVSFQLGINLKYLDETGKGIEMKEDLATTIAHEMTHAVMFDATTNGMLGAYGADQFPSWFVEGTAQAVGGAINYCSTLVNSAMPKGDGAISNWLSDLTDTSNSYNAYAQGYIASMYLGYTAGCAAGVGPAVSAGTIASGLDNILKDIEDGYSLGQAISRQTKGKYYDLADFEDSFSKDAVKFTKDLVTAIGSGTGSIASPDGLSGTKASLINKNPQTISKDDYFVLNVDNQSYTNELNGKNTYTGGGATTTSGLDRDGNTNPDAESTWGSSSDAKRGTVQRSGILSVQVGAEAHQTIEMSTFMLSTNDLGIADVKVDSMDNAGKAIDKYKTAINCISIMRSEYGAVQNRLEHTIANLDNMAEKMQSAESLIRDTDIAEEMVEYSINNILEQSGVSILAQANQSAQNAMRLLQ